MTSPDSPLDAFLVRQRLGFPWWRILLGVAGAIVALLGVMAAVGMDEPEDVTWTVLVLIGLMVAAGPLSVATALLAVRLWERRRHVSRDTAAAVLLLQRAPEAPGHQGYVATSSGLRVLEFRVVQSSTPTIPVGLHLALTAGSLRVPHDEREFQGVVEAWQVLEGDPHFVVHRPGSDQWWVGDRDGRREGWPHPPLLRAPDPWTAPLVSRLDRFEHLQSGWGIWGLAVFCALFSAGMLEKLSHTIPPLLMAAVCGALALLACRPVRVRPALLRVNEQNHHGRLVLGVERVVYTSRDDDSPTVTQVSCRVLASSIPPHKVGTSVSLETEETSAPMHAEIHGTLEALAPTHHAGELVVHRTGSPGWWRTRAL